MIRPYLPFDRIHVATLLGLAYGRTFEPWLVQTLRDAGDIQSEFVFEEGGQAIGHISLVRHLHPKGWVMISTVAVTPEAQGRGIGSDLVRAALEVARQADAPAVTVLGNARYYQRFGFTRTAAEALETPFAQETTLMYPIRIETAGIMAELVYPGAYSRL